MDSSRNQYPHPLLRRQELSASAVKQLLLQLHSYSPQGDSSFSRNFRNKNEPHPTNSQDEVKPEEITRSRVCRQNLWSTAIIPKKEELPISPHRAWIGCTLNVSKFKMGRSLLLYSNLKSDLTILNFERRKSLLQIRNQGQTFFSVRLK